MENLWEGMWHNYPKFGINSYYQHTEIDYNLCISYANIDRSKTTVLDYHIAYHNINIRNTSSIFQAYISTAHLLLHNAIPTLDSMLHYQCRY